MASQRDPSVSPALASKGASAPDDRGALEESAPAEPTVRSLFELATRDHEAHVQLIERARRDRSGHGPAHVAADLRRLARAEHRGLLGALLAHATSRAIARRAVASQAKLDRLVADLACCADPVERGVALATYRAAFIEHARLVEHELYPVAHLTLGERRCDELASVYAAAHDEHESLAP